MKISRINYKNKSKFVKYEDGFLRILHGANIEELNESEFLLVYDLKKMLSPIKPSKIITINKNFKFKYIRANNSVVNPSANILTFLDKLYLTPQIGLVVGKDRIFSFLIILSFYSKYFNDARDYALDTYSPFSEFMARDFFPKFKIKIDKDIFEFDFSNIEPESIYNIAKKFFNKLYIGDIIAYENDEIELLVKDQSNVELISEYGRTLNKVIQIPSSKVF
ncbi:MAG: hypothetical protein N2504_04855 [candidate division WOR-3 bacterium]|nr:hypothetical protein [candidate division WOR-3 bacterium]MCX7947898.1 hypothetical protein [candidate division WOR-3 bacterium]MDW8150720.1 hypothetical protein [candidate division WOR-3 bacterium]